MRKHFRGRNNFCILDPSLLQLEEWNIIPTFLISLTRGALKQHHAIFKNPPKAPPTVHLSRTQVSQTGHNRTQGQQSDERRCHQLRRRTCVYVLFVPVLVSTLVAHLLSVVSWHNRCGGIQDHSINQSKDEYSREAERESFRTDVRLFSDTGLENDTLGNGHCLQPFA